MKLAELLPLIIEQTMIELSYLSGSDARVACCCDDDYWDYYGRPELLITVDGWEA